MRLKILGSGGACAIPRPGCDCEICHKARKDGIPYARTGPSMYVYGSGGILFDTPEEIRQQLEREQITQVSHVFYTHWHPDHTQGLRLFEQMQLAYPDEHKKPAIDVYIPINDLAAFEDHCKSLWYFQKQGWINIHEFDDRYPIQIGELWVIPLDFKRHDRVRYGYLIIEDEKKVLYAPCSTYRLVTDHFYKNLDLMISEAGWTGSTKEVRASLPPKHTWLDHISFEETVELFRKIKPKQAILTHIDGTRHHLPSASNDYLCQLAAEVTDIPIDIAYDGMQIEL